MSEEILPKELTSNVARRGKWTVEEERYTEQIIEDFDQGVLDVPEGTTLRTYLSRVLNCDPMRITKKYTGNLCIGKRTFVPKPTVYESDFQYLGQCYSRLIELRQCWINKLLLTEQWNNRKLNQFRGTKPPMDEPLPNLVPPVGFNPVSLFTFSSLNPTPPGMMTMMVPEPGASVSPPNEEVSLTSAATTSSTAVTTSGEVVEDLCFSEFKVFSAIRPFVKDIVETELIIDWLKACSEALSASASALDAPAGESQLLDQLTSTCRLSMASLYKVLLSGCVAEFKLLHSCVQAVFERMILANEGPRPSSSAAPSSTVSSVAPTTSTINNSGSGGSITLAASMMPLSLSSTDLQKLETVSNDGQDTVVSEQSSSDEISQCTKRAKYEHPSFITTSSAVTPTHASGSDGAAEFSSTPLLPTSSAATFTANPVTPTARALEDCVHQLKHKRSLQLVQGPISATAAQYREQQQRALSSAASVGTAPAFLIDPQTLSQKLTTSLNQSMVNISRSVLDHKVSGGFSTISSSNNNNHGFGGLSNLSGPGNNHMMYVTPSNIESAAEALLGLIAN